MENSTPNSRSMHRKQTCRRTSSNQYNFSRQTSVLYSSNQLKMVLVIGLIREFERQRQTILENYQQEKQKKLTQTGMHFNRMSTTLSIQPTRKEIINVNQTSKQLSILSEALQGYLQCNQKKPEARKSVLGYSIFNNSTISFDNIKLTQTAKILNQNKENRKIHQQIVKKQNYQQQVKQNIVTHMNSKIHKHTHRRYASDFNNWSRKSSQGKEISSQKRKQKIFMSKKKQQIQFLRKMTVQFATEQAQFKALVEIMQVFMRNYNRANYYLKMIDHNLSKCKKIIIYVSQLTKIFNKIIQILRQISKLNKGLSIKQDNSKNFRVQFKQLPPEVDQYYSRSYEMIKIIRHFSLLQNFPIVMKSQKQICANLVSLFIEARYILKYLQKQIQISETVKKENTKLPKWQKAFKAKFLPKNTLV